jgi:integrase
VAAKRRFAAATALRRRADLGCRDAVGSSSCPLTRGQLERLFAHRDLPLRERTLWRLLDETAARANELLALDVQDLDLASRRARVHSKGGAVEWAFWPTGSAQPLPRLLAGRTSGPVFLGDRRPARPVAGLDLDQASGRARLSYRRAAELFRVCTGWTLHQLRHSALTHAAEDGTNLPLLLARSRHASMRSLERYARPGPEAVARHLAETDPARRRPDPAPSHLQAGHCMRMSPSSVRNTSVPTLEVDLATSGVSRAPRQTDADGDEERRRQQAARNRTRGP